MSVGRGVVSSGGSSKFEDFECRSNVTLTSLGLRQQHSLACPSMIEVACSATVYTDVYGEKLMDG